MKLSLTGHSKGLGAEIQKQAQEKGWSVLGFSRSNGFDISCQADRKKILEMSSECDIFINNASSGYAQLDLLYESFEEWKNSNKIIVVVGSLAANAAEWRLKACKYSVVKKALDCAVYQLINSHQRSKGLDLFIFKPGYLNTEMVDYKSLSAWIDTTDAAEHLISNLCQRSKYRVVEVVMRPVERHV